MSAPLGLTRSEAELLLPFHANGALGEAEEREIEAWIARDGELAAEAAWLREIRAGLREAPLESPGEAGLARLFAALDAAEPVAASAPAVADARPDTRMVAPPAPAANLVSRPWIWQCAAALATAAFLGQSLSLWRAEGPAAAPQGFELAGAADVARAAAGPRLTIGFAPEAGEGEIRALLVGLGLEITSGPSALGLYRLSGAGAEEIETLLAALRASPLVETAEHDTD